MATVPTDEQVLDAILLIRHDLKRELEPPKNVEPLWSPIEIPSNALAVQQRYKDKSTRCFKLYGRGQYEFGVTPNADMQLLIGEDIGRQLKAESSSYLPTFTPREIEHQKAVFKENSMKMKRAMLRDPKTRGYIPVDARCEPLWDEEKNGQ
ncbi:hypothetical protein K458DRAFT_433232 [Lentithecium fluviatile CBS 122367]|uniref:Uncharacterized protein n=1 Tax=Lentithecium fluviatile CBS 122367 TaxID=1168545 RepID=A0A6G1IWN5_9PLEO|nr:hypothetical protein K458DRAFT_433232 [Lentithecium fluviatile CBS 122367]